MEGLYAYLNYMNHNHSLHKYGQVPFIDGIQRSDEPVSKCMTNFWGGVPTVMFMA